MRLSFKPHITLYALRYTHTKQGALYWDFVHSGFKKVQFNSFVRDKDKLKEIMRYIMGTEVVVVHTKYRRRFLSSKPSQKTFKSISSQW